MAQNLFFPKIDQNLWQRFIETFDNEERFSIGLSSQDAQKYIPLNNIKLTNSFFNWNKKFLTSDDIIVVIGNLDIYDTDKKEIVFKEITSKKVFCKVRILYIDTLNIPIQELSQIIGSYTKEIEIAKVYSNITFAEIIRNTPNIEVLKIFHNNWISKQATWLEDLYKYKEGNNFRELLIHLDIIEFDIETLKKFVETKSVSGVIIKIRYENREKRKAFHQFAGKMSELFNERNYPKYDETSYINLEFYGTRDFKCFTLDMNKNDRPPLIKRQKINK
uniref:DUF38 domain-containing protein n=1 Tax=Panagrolaimus davidi TaxID=227884 RepID=A0A914P6V3_9BILA